MRSGLSAAAAAAAVSFRTEIGGRHILYPVAVAGHTEDVKSAFVLGNVYQSDEMNVIYWFGSTRIRSLNLLSTVIQFLTSGLFGISLVLEFR